MTAAISDGIHAAPASRSSTSRGPLGIAGHYLRYSAGNLSTLVAGLVSFPILTRLLDNTQYGILSYYDTLVLMAVAIGKLGAQHAILRFHPHDGDARSMAAFSTNLFYVPFAISMALWLCGVVGLLLWDAARGTAHAAMLWLALAVTPVMIFSSFIETAMRAAEHSGTVMRLRIVWRWLEVGLIVGAVLMLQHSAVAAYAGKLAAAVAVLVFFIAWMRRHMRFVPSLVDLRQTREGFIYGMPLVGNEILSVARVALDRLMIRHLMADFSAVGVYSIGASLAVQVNVLLNISVFETLMPMANRVYQTDGAPALRALKARFLLPMTYAAVAISLLLACFGSDVIVALSGSAKSASGPVFAVLGALYALQCVLLVAGYGLLLERRSNKVMTLMAMTLVVNLVLGYVLIPRFGVMGAVYATSVGSIAYAIGHCMAIRRDMLQLPDARSVLTACAAAVACAALAWSAGIFGLQAGWQRLLAGGGVTGVAYVAGVYLCDGRLRALLRFSLPGGKRNRVAG